MVTTSKTGIKHILLSIQEKLNIISMVDATYNFPHKKLLKNFASLSKLKTKHRVLKWQTNSSARKR
jgi:hypothetical protein